MSFAFSLTNIFHFLPRVNHPFTTSPCSSTPLYPWSNFRLHPRPYLFLIFLSPFLSSFHPPHLSFSSFLFPTSWPHLHLIFWSCSALHLHLLSSCSLNLIFLSPFSILHLILSLSLIIPYSYCHLPLIFTSPAYHFLLLLSFPPLTVIITSPAYYIPLIFASSPSRLHVTFP